MSTTPSPFAIGGVTTPSPEPPLINAFVGASSNGTTADTEISSQGLSEFLTTLLLSAILGLGLWLLFEIKRNKRSVYAPRPAKLPHRAPPALAYGPLRWVWTVAALPGSETLRLAGMDAYCLLRFIYLCLRICLFSSFWGMLVLTPVYVLDGSEAENTIYYVTLANVPSGSDTLWVTVVFAYLFTWHALYVLRGEHQAFAEMREEFLTKGDPDFATQTRYTTKVENVPAELRSAVALEAYFEDLFPGCIHSAVMCLNMPNLEAKVERREIVADKLEKTRSLQLLTGKVVQHRNRRFPCDCCGAASGVSEAEYLAGELAKLNEEIEKEQKAFLQAAQRLNSMDDRLMRAASVARKMKGKGGGEREEEEGAAVSSERPESKAASVDQIDFFLKTKSEKESQWAMQEVEDVSDVSPSSRRLDEGRTGSSSLDVEGGGAAESASGIEEELEARRRRSKNRSPSSGGDELKPGPRPGATSALDVDTPLAGGAAGLIEAAPDMAKEALSSLASVGNSAFHTTRRVARGVLYLTLGQRMSTTGFVTFRQMAACAASRQVLLAPRPDWCDCEPAPDPRDVVWKNIAVPQPQNDLRQNVAACLVAAGAIFWSIPVLLIQFWASYSQLEKIFPVLADLDPDSFLYYVIAGYLPVVLLLLLMLLLPFLFQALAYRYERRKSHSEVQQSILTRYFTYQVANIYVTVASGSIISALQEILDDPTSVLNILGETFPAVAVYFLDVIIVKLFVGLPFELLRGWPLIRVLWSQRCTNRDFATEREIRTGPFGPAELLYGWVYPTLLLVLVVCFVYAVISPFIMPAGAIFFALAYLVYKYQALYVYVPKYESGGVFWFSVYPRVLIGLALAQLTLAGYVYVRAGITQASLILPLPALIYWYGYRSFKRYLGPAESISMETAARIDRRGASAMAAAVKAAAEGRRGRHWQDSGRQGRAGEDEEDDEDGGVNPDEFEPLLYAQLALTSPSVEPSDCSPRESAVEASQRRERGTSREGGADSGGAGRNRSGSRGGIVVQERGDATVTPFPEARHKPGAAAVGDRALVVSDNDRSPEELRLPSSPLRAAGVAVDGPAGKPSAEARKEEQGAERALNDEEHALGLENGAAAEGPVIVSANAAADAAALAASDRNANGWFQPDGLIDNSTEGRPLTRREKEGLERRALAAKSLASLNPRVNGAPDPETRRSRVGSGTLSSLDGAGDPSSGLPSPAALASLQAPLLGSRAAAARVAANDDRSSSADYVEV